MTPEVGQAKPRRACPRQTAFSVATGEFMNATSRVGQVGQVMSYCTHVSLFSEWKGKRRGYNRGTPVPLVPVNENRTDDTESGDSWDKPTPAELVPPSSPIPSGYMVIPWPIDIDPLYTGRLTGKVPDGWTRDGWIISLRDRITRTHMQPGRRMLQAELDAIEATVKPSPQGDRRAPLRRARRAGAETPSERAAIMSVEIEAEGAAAGGKV